MLANSYFKFKQFTVHQQLCAMKVSTDSCIFGALAAQALATRALYKNSSMQAYLDIGAGTGFLSLMLAQKTTAAIEAVEIDADAYLQTIQNFKDSPFNKKLTIFNKNIILFDTGKKYDAIICNPPFYEQDLRSDNAGKNAAKHDTTLTLKQLLQAIDRLLKPDGMFAILLPVKRVDYFISEALEFNLFVKEKIIVKHSLLHPEFRGILFFTQDEVTVTSKELIIKKEDGSYTTDFIDLLKDYYLHL